MVEDSWDTCPRRGGRTCGAILTAVWWFGPQNHLALRMTGFAEFGSQNSAAMVPVGIGGGTTKGASRQSNFVWSM
jgi:hypothetical protein